jgi:hypothetical protein
MQSIKNKPKHDWSKAMTNKSRAGSMAKVSTKIGTKGKWAMPDNGDYSIAGTGDKQMLRILVQEQVTIFKKCGSRKRPVKILNEGPGWINVTNAHGGNVLMPMKVTLDFGRKFALSVEHGSFWVVRLERL